METSSQTIDQPTLPPAGEADPRAALVPAKPTPKAKTNKLTAAERRFISLDKSYHEMDAAALNREFKRLDSIAAKEGKNAKHALERAIPHLSDIQMLTSQRGAMRKQVLAAARVPGWSDYLNKYSDNYGVSASTIKRRIVAYRGKSGAQPKPKRDDPPPPPPKLTTAQTRKAIKAITVAGDAFAAYKAGNAIEPFVDQWEKVAFTPEEQTAIIDMLEGNVDTDAELTRKTIAIIKTGQSYIRWLEEFVPWDTLTDEQEFNHRKRSDPWAKLLRYVAGLEEASKEAA
jgi:hypothetical protein